MMLLPLGLTYKGELLLAFEVCGFLWPLQARFLSPAVKIISHHPARARWRVALSSGRARISATAPLRSRLQEILSPKILCATMEISGILEGAN